MKFYGPLLVLQNLEKNTSMIILLVEENLGQLYLYDHLLLKENVGHIHPWSSIGSRESGTHIYIYDHLLVGARNCTVRKTQILVRENMGQFHL